MKERFDDEKYYSEDQDFGAVTITDFVKVLNGYSYARYVARFRMLAKQHQLAPSRRPKLSAENFLAQIDQLRRAIARAGEAQLLNDPLAQKIASRLLVLDLIEEELL